jgi:EVE domain
MTGYWIAVASANHVARGKAEGFMQVNHGKAAPLKRMKPGDIIAYYSPVTAFGGTEKLRAFTAIGRVKEGEPYQGSMGEGFKPFRRDVEWFEAQQAAIEPLLQELDFTRGKKSWGYQFRFGFFEISESDMRIIARAMSSVWANG